MYGSFSRTKFSGIRRKKIAEAARFQEKPEKKKSKQEKEPETPWDWYIYVSLTLLNWSEDFFLKATPNLWLKSYINWLKANTEFEEKETLTLDQSPFW